MPKVYVPAPAGQEAIVFNGHAKCRILAERPTGPIIERYPVVAWAIDPEDGGVPVLPTAYYPETPDNWLLITLPDGRLYDVDGGTYDNLADATDVWLVLARQVWDAAHPDSAAAA